jgi:hypothetical protein
VLGFSDDELGRLHPKRSDFVSAVNRAIGKTGRDGHSSGRRVSGTYIEVHDSGSSVGRGPVGGRIASEQAARRGPEIDERVRRFPGRSA